MSRPRDRASAEGLLPGMEARQWKSDLDKFTYRYHPTGGKPINLGTDKNEALQRVLDMNKAGGSAHGTLQWLWTQYQKSKRWVNLSEGTQNDYGYAWKQLDKVFGAMQARSIKPPMVARYVHIHRADTPRRANIERTLLANILKHGILVGVCDSDPTVDVQPHTTEASTVLPSALAIERFAKWLNDGQSGQRKVLSCAMRFAALGGSRQVEFLQVTWAQVDYAAGVIRLIRAKQKGKKKDQVVDLIRISPALGQLLNEIKALDRDCPYLFPTEDNNAYTAGNFKTFWGRCIKEAIKAKVIAANDRFNFHSLRRFYATTHKATHGALPDLHANPAITARVYDGTKQVERKAL